jgi:glycosyltransferase involved in cell wall biosynthesis
VKKKKVCVIAGYAPSILNFRKELILEIAKTCDVFVCAPFITTELKTSIENLGAVLLDARMSPESMNPFTNISYLYALFSHFKAVKPDVVLSYTIKPVIWASIAAKLAGVSYISSIVTGLGYSFTELDSLKRRIINKLVCRLYKWALSFNQMVFFQNKDDRSIFQDKKILGHTPSLIINGSGVNLAHFYHCEHYPEQISFLMMGRLLKDKGIYEYIEAARRIHSQYKNITFDLMGWIDNNPSSITPEELTAWCDDGVVNFLGKLEDVRHSLQASSVFVLPSYREGTPRSVLEAISMGRPIITTDAPGCRETVAQGVNGYLVPVKNVDRLNA